MYGCNITQKAVVLLSVLFIGSLAFGAETWTLGQDEQWQAVSENPRARYLLEVSKLKELINQGKTDELADAIARLKQDYPEIAGPDLESYLEGDKAFAAGNFTKAVRAYDTFLARYPESALYEAALDRELEIAQAYLSGHKKRVLKFFKIRGYAEGVRVADKVIDRAGDTPMAVRTSVVVAESFEKRAKYQDAYERWSQISSRWPTGETGKTALLAMARCKQAAYRGPNFDASNLLSAKSYYENFMTRYPEESKTYEIGKRLEQINEQLAYKEYTIAEYYERTGSDESSEIYCEMVENQWPKSTGAKRAKDIAEQIELKEQEKEEQEKK
jgi:outer membrane protein assembly factor BamD (BamD/ComL family)